MLNISVTNQPPLFTEASNELPPLTIKANALFQFPIPENLFLDLDNDTINYVVYLYNHGTIVGIASLEWLNYNSSNRLLFGIAVKKQDLRLAILFDDSYSDP